MITIEPPADFGRIDEAVETMATFDWVVFTSSNGVRGLMDRVAEVGRDARVFGSSLIAVIGPATNETLASYHLRADFVAESHGSEALAAGLVEKGRGCAFLLVQADRGRPTLREQLGKIAHVVRLPTYENRDAEAIDDDVLRRLREGSVDWITVTSSAIANRLHDLLPQDVRERVGSSIRLASLSPLTTSALVRLGWRVDVEAATATWDALIGEIATRVASGTAAIEPGPPR